MVSFSPLIYDIICYCIVGSDRTTVTVIISFFTAFTSCCLFKRQKIKLYSKLRDQLLESAGLLKCSF